MNRLLELLRSQEFADALRYLQSVTLTGNMGKVWKSDAQKIELFVRDCFAFVMGEGAKAFDALKQNDPAGAEIILAGLAPFLGELEAIMKAYAKRAESISKFQFPKDIWSGKFRDPFRPERVAVELFRAKWL